MATSTEEVFEERTLNFRETVLASQGVAVTQQFIFAGRITQVMFHFPPGTNGLVQLRLYKNQEPFYPQKGFIALDDATPVYYVESDYYKNEPLTFEVQNTDGINPHTVSCSVTIKFKAPRWW